MTKQTQNDRLQIRCSKEEKAFAQRAADKERRSLSSFVVVSMIERAERLLDEEFSE